METVGDMANAIEAFINEDERTLYEIEEYFDEICWLSTVGFSRSLLFAKIMRTLQDSGKIFLEERTIARASRRRKADV